MAEQVYNSYPPQLTPEQQTYLVQTVKDWSIFHGLTVRPSSAIVDEQTNQNHVLATNAPVTLFPSPFPRTAFEQARNIQQTYNDLYAAISDDEAWLEEAVKELVEVDDFIANLWKIHVAVRDEGYVQDMTLGLFRSDYMLNALDDSSVSSLKQVEFNTISSSFGGLSTRVAQLHTELASFPSQEYPAAYPAHPLFSKIKTGPQENLSQLRIKSQGLPPRNDAVTNLVSGLAAAHNAYGSTKSTPALPHCVIFLVQDGERNLFDQYALSTQLLSEHNINSFRLPVSQILGQTSVSDGTADSSRPLIYTPPSTPHQRFEVTVVYLRALYTSSEYNTPTSWQARHHIERSAAIKCPSVLLQLSGSKKVQQALTSTAPDHLKHFLPTHSESALSSLRSTFAPQYALSDSDPSSTEGLAIAFDPARAENHVLKPQREGGGNNIYRSNIPPFLKSIPKNDYKQYILMELIKPPKSAKNTVLRSDGQVVSGDVISELGIFGTCLWRKSRDHGKRDILHNTEGGYLMRTKGKDSDEGGVAAGFSSLDSLILYE